MDKNFVKDQINRSNRNLFLVNLSVIISILWFFLAGGASGSGSFIATIFYGGLFLLGIWNLVKAFKRWKKFSSHPINVYLNKIGPAEKVAEIINKELTHSRTNLKPAILTESWLLIPTFFGLQITLLSELVWVYKKVTQNYTYFIPTSKNFAVILYRRDGQQIEVSCNEKNGDLLMQTVADAAPGIVLGFNQEIESLWNTKRGEFIAYVDQKKREHKNSLKKADN